MASLPTQSDAAYHALEEAIVTLSIAPGTVVTEQEMMARSGFGRTPVREAIQRLERDMLVVVFPRRGILIEPIDVPRALMTLEVRERIEPFVMERAARLAEEGERMAFRRLAAEIEAAAAQRDRRAFTRLDRRLNDLVAECARHEVAIRLVQPLQAVWRRIGYFTASQDADRPDPAAPIHAALARAIAGNDQEAVAAATASLFETCRRVVLDLEGIVPRPDRRHAGALR